MSDERPNIVLITADSVRADRCGFVDESAGTTPVLDRLASRSVVFENAVAPGPRTPSSIPEIVTGEPMTHADVDSNSLRSQVDHIRTHLDRYRTLAEELAEIGYSTAAYTANPYTTTHSGFDAGFDVFHSIESNERSRFGKWGLRLFDGTHLGTPVSKADQFRRKGKYFSQWPTLYSKALPTIESMESPYFLWFFLLDAHNPYVVPRRDRVDSSTLGMYYSVFRGNTKLGHTSDQSAIRPSLSPHVETGLKRAYKDAVRSVDRFVGVLKRKLASDDPLLVFHSDHGEAFDEHGSYGHQPELYEENVHTPLFIHDPTAERPARVREPVTLRTLPEMVLSYAIDGEEPTSPRWQSEYVTADTVTGEKVAVRGERWKYISTAGSEELYDLKSDPDERTDVIDRNPAKAGELREVLKMYVRELPEAADRSTSDRRELPSEIADSLRALGYAE
jgi:arylsulfatase A-like enzyme